MIAGYRCAACGATVDIAEPLPFRCPNATAADRHHVLRLVASPVTLRPSDDPDPFVAFGPYLAWRAFAGSHGMRADACDALTRSLSRSVAQVDGRGFAWTPFGRADRLSDALGFSSAGGVWVKDETGNVSGSHKARHLVSTLLQLLAGEQLGVLAWRSTGDRPKLAIASCGNAALAAATMAASIGWPLDVFVPPSANGRVVARLGELGAVIVVCPRRADDLPGDPCVHRFREAVARGSIPFSVQGPENALCLDSGRTLGWEVGLQYTRDPNAAGTLDRLFVQVGGGALATCAATGLRDHGIVARLHAVQTAGCAPLARAWQQANSIGVRTAPTRWAECMWPWEPVVDSAATGILDDETYDWVGVVDAMAGSGGQPATVTEHLVAEANALALARTDIAVDPTGSAGLAGVLLGRGWPDVSVDPADTLGPSDGRRVGRDENVVVVFSGRTR